MRRPSLVVRSLARAQRGVAAIEFALVFLLFVSILYGVASLGAVFYTQQVLARAAEDGARAVSLLGATPVTANDGRINTVVLTSLASSLIAPSSVGTSQAARSSWVANPSNVSVTVDTACGGVSGCVKVTVAYQYANNRILPVLPLISWAPSTLTAFAVAPK